MYQEMERACDSKSDKLGVQSIPSSLLMERDSLLPPRQPKTRRALPPPPPHERSRVSLDRAIELELIHGRHLDPTLDGKMIRRTVSNRLSAQRSRMKKSRQLADMERKAQDLEKLVNSLTPKLEAYEEKKRLLQLENESLRAQLDIRQAQSQISQDGLEQRRREIMELKEMLRQKGVELQPSTSVLEKIQISGPQEHTMQVSEFSGPQEHTMQVSGLEDEMMRGSGREVEEEGPKPYSIEFYEQRLMQMEMKQFIEQELTSAAEAEEEGEEEEVEVEVDQYLNLDELS